METFNISASTENFMLWVLVGIFIGFTAHIHESGKVAGGGIASSIFGSIGGITGGFFSSFLSGRTVYGLRLQELTVAIAASLVFTLFYRNAFRIKSYIKIDNTTMKGTMTYVN